MLKKKKSSKKERELVKTKKESLRIVSTIAPKSESKKSGLEKEMDEIDLEEFSKFITPISVKSNVPSLDIIAPIRKLEEVTPVRNDSKKGEKEIVSYDTNTRNAYSDNGAYASGSNIKYEGGGADGHVSVHINKDDLMKRKDFIRSDARDFITPELRNQNDDYVTKQARVYDSQREDIEKKKKNKLFN